MELRSFRELPTWTPESAPQVAAPLSPKQAIRFLATGLSKFIQRPACRELVAGGVVRWKPVNTEAAKLLSRASDIHKPPPENMSRGRALNSHAVELALKTANPEQSNSGCRQTFADPQKAGDLSCMTGNKIINKAKAMPQQLEEFTKQVKDARAALDDATDMFRRDVLDFVDELPECIKKVREWRMTMEREKTLGVQALSEIRRFFLDSDHEKEMTRLSEFVRLCERLKALAADGTLDKVADVMIKLA